MQVPTGQRLSLNLNEKSKDRFNPILAKFSCLFHISCYNVIMSLINIYLVLYKMKDVDLGLGLYIGYACSAHGAGMLYI